MALFLLPDNEIIFPDPRLAEEDGLLAFGGDLRPERIIEAYSRGIFPWYNDPGPIMWWAPDPRCVLFPGKVHISKSMKKWLKKREITVTLDRAFKRVMESCGKVPRKDQAGTWITRDMVKSYTTMYRMGYAHSIEVWRKEKLVGGLYGVSIGDVFFGESMFSKEKNSSKTALLYLSALLKKHNFQVIDCQIVTDHLLSMGAKEISIEKFIGILKERKEKNIVLEELDYDEFLEIVL